MYSPVYLLRTFCGYLRAFVSLSSLKVYNQVSFHRKFCSRSLFDWYPSDWSTLAQTSIKGTSRKSMSLESLSSSTTATLSIDDFESIYHLSLPLRKLFDLSSANIFTKDSLLNAVSLIILSCCSSLLFDSIALRSSDLSSIRSGKPAVRLLSSDILIRAVKSANDFDWH